MAKNTFPTLSEDFRKQLPPHTPEERAALKTALLKHGGCHDPLIAWKEQSILLDGYTRVELLAELKAEGHTLPQPAVVWKSFKDEREASRFVRLHQISRRNIDDWQKMKLAMNDPEVVEELAKEKKKAQARQKTGTIVPTKDKGRSIDSICGTLGINKNKFYEFKRVLESKPEDFPNLIARVDAGQITPTQAAQHVKRTVEKQERAIASAKAAKIIVPLEHDGWRDQIYCMDVLDGLKKIPDESVSLVVTSPKYALPQVEYTEEVEPYDGDYLAYLDWLTQVLTECRRVLRPFGRLILNFDDCFGKEAGKTVRHNCFMDFSIIMQKELGMTFRDRISWYKQNCVANHPMVGSMGSPAGPRIQNNCEHIGIWAKGNGSMTSEDGTQTIDITDDEFYQYTIQHWYIPPNSDKSNHPCPWPLELPKQLIKLFTFKGDTVLDPFVGSGSSAVAAVLLGRHYVGIDISKEYVKYAREQVTMAVEQAKVEAEKPLDIRKVLAEVKPVKCHTIRLDNYGGRVKVRGGKSKSNSRIPAQ